MTRRSPPGPWGRDRCSPGPGGHRRRRVAAHGLLRRPDGPRPQPLAPPAAPVLGGHGGGDRRHRRSARHVPGVAEGGTGRVRGAAARRRPGRERQADALGIHRTRAPASPVAGLLDFPRLETTQPRPAARQAAAASSPSTPAAAPGNPATSAAKACPYAPSPTQPGPVFAERLGHPPPRRLQPRERLPHRRVVARLLRRHLPGKLQVPESRVRTAGPQLGPCDLGAVVRPAGRRPRGRDDYRVQPLSAQLVRAAIPAPAWRWTGVNRNMALSSPHLTR